MHTKNLLAHRPNLFFLINSFCPSKYWVICSVYYDQYIDLFSSSYLDLIYISILILSQVPSTVFWKFKISTLNAFRLLRVKSNLPILCECGKPWGDMNDRKASHRLIRLSFTLKYNVSVMYRCWKEHVKKYVFKISVTKKKEKKKHIAMLKLFMILKDFCFSFWSKIWIDLNHKKCEY